jgi:hypothetical protein
VVDFIGCLPLKANKKRRKAHIFCFSAFWRWRVGKSRASIHNRMNRAALDDGSGHCSIVRVLGLIIGNSWGILLAG